jgi:DNA-binding MarR family transcriptional regulator
MLYADINGHRMDRMKSPISGRRASANQTSPGSAAPKGRRPAVATPSEENTASALLDAVGPAFSRLRRSALLKVEDPLPRKDMTRTLVLNLVEEGPEVPDQEITVGVIAERLAVDPSVASRMVSDCIVAGYLVRVASQLDGRRTILELTHEGELVLERFRKHQRSAFEYITQDWPEGERLEFARLLIKYVDTLEELPRRQQPGNARFRAPT